MSTVQSALTTRAASGGWRALAACMVIAAIGQGVFVSCFPLWVVPWIAEFHVSRGLALAGFAAGNLVMGLASPVVGICIERFSARLVIALGGIVLGIGFVLGSVALSFWQLVALYASVLPCGAAFAGLIPTQSVAVRAFPHRAGTASGAITVGASAGGIILPPALTALLATEGWRPVFLLAGAIAVMTIVPCAWALLKGYDRARESAATADEGPVTADAAPVRTRELLGRLEFWVPLMAGVPTMMLIGTVMANAVAIAVDNGIPLRVAGYLVSAIPAGGVSGSLGLGWLCDRMDYRRVFGICAAATVLALLLLGGHVTPLPLAIAFAVMGIVVGGAFPVVGVMVVRSFGARVFPRVMGLLMPPMIVAMAISPVIAGWVRDRTGSYGIVFYCCAALMAFSGAAIVALGVSPRRPTTSAADLSARS